jgi:hypothetical protein
MCFTFNGPKKCLWHLPSEGFKFEQLQYSIRIHHHCGESYNTVGATSPPKCSSDPSLLFFWGASFSYVTTAVLPGPIVLQKYLVQVYVIKVNKSFII